MVHANPLLHKALAGQRGVTGLNADCCTRADTIEQLVAVVDRRHAELGQQLPVEGAGRIKLAYRQNDVGPLMSIVVAKPSVAVTIRQYITHSLSAGMVLHSCLSLW